MTQYHHEFWISSPINSNMCRLAETPPRPCSSPEVLHWPLFIVCCYIPDSHMQCLKGTRYPFQGGLTAQGNPHPATPIARSPSPGTASAWGCRRLLAVRPPPGPGPSFYPTKWGPDFWWPPARIMEGPPASRVRQPRDSCSCSACSCWATSSPCSWD